MKSLAIAYDTHDSERTARILSFCSGVENLTIWAIPSPDPTDVQVNRGFHHHASLPRVPQYTSLQFAASTLGLPNQLHALLHVFIYDLRPKRLAILIDKPLYMSDTAQVPHLGWNTSHHPSPNFSLGLFTNLTHLSIVNRWTDWSTWSWKRDGTASRSHDIAPRQLSSLELLPRLTHLSLEIQVGKRLISREFGLPSNPASLQHHNRKLAESVGLSLARILTSSGLHVLLCILTFDDAPHSTAHTIKLETTNNITMLLGALEPTSLQVYGGANFTKLGDPRLVFAYDKQPFREREAGSCKVWNMWKRAEEIVRLQMQGQVTDGYGRCLFGHSSLH